MGKHPVFAPQFADKRVGVGQRGGALGGFADVGDDVFGLDLIAVDQVGYRRLGAGFVVVEQAHAFALEKADAEAVDVVVGKAAAHAEAFEGEDDVGGGVAVHPQQLAHWVVSLVELW